jgi:hypothetical protein
MAANFDDEKHYSPINTESHYEVLRGIKFPTVADSVHQINPRLASENDRTCSICCTSPLLLLLLLLLLKKQECLITTKGTG